MLQIRKTYRSLWRYRRIERRYLQAPFEIRETTSDLLSKLKRIIDAWIIAADDITESAIIQDEILISNLPSVQLASLFRDIETTNKSFAKQIKCNVIDAALKELGETTISNCNVPSKEKLYAIGMGASIIIYPKWFSVRSIVQQTKISGDILCKCNRELLSTDK